MSEDVINAAGREPASSRASNKGSSASASQHSDAEIDRAIGLAQDGRVNLTPTKAVDMAGRLYVQGKFAQAERVSRQIVAARPALADAHNILGASLAALGRGEEAAGALRRAIKLNPSAASYRSNLGEILRRDGALDEAAGELNAATRLDPDNALAHNNLGIVHFERGEFLEAAECYRRGLQIDPTLAEAYNNLGNALRSVGDHEGALNAYEAALTQRMLYPEAYNNLGTLLVQEQRFEEAEHALRKAIQQKPLYVEAHNNLAQLLFGQGNEVEALRILGDALKFASNNTETLLLTARIQLHRNNLEPAEQAVRLALKHDPENADALIVLGQVLHETDRYEDAIVALEQALGKDLANPHGLNFYGVALKSVGRLDEARDAILKALQLNDTMYGAYANLNDLVDFSDPIGAHLFDRMEAIFETVGDSSSEPFTALHFAFAKALDDRGEHERALQHYITGGQMKRAQLDYDEADTHAFFDAIRAAFPKEVFEKRKYEGLKDDRLVFIVGMPRSGSTLVEQILASHPGVHGAGEVKYLARALGQLRDRFPSLPKYPEMSAKLSNPQLEIVARDYQKALSAGAGEARKITDKLLTNYFFVGLINLLFPKAKVIHTRRDPVDTCLSAFTKLFKDDMPHSYELGELGRYYAKYRELMNHWEEVLPRGTMTTVVYEDVVADLEKEARRLIAFLGLPWDPRCVDFHKSDRPVKTASVAQVRKPIYRSSLQRWKRYGEGLRPLFEAIAT